MVTYNQRIMGTGFSQTGGDTETQEFCKLQIENSITPGGDTNSQISIAANVTERCKFVTAPWKPNTLDWTGGTYTWRWRVTTAGALNIIEVILRRVSNDCQTVKASKSSGVISVSLNTTGVKTGTISWNDGTQNPGTKSTDDRFEVVFRIQNTNTMSAVTSNVGFEHTTAGNDDLTAPFSETTGTATTPKGFIKTIVYQKPASGTTGVQTITATGAGRIKGIKAIVSGSTNNTGTFQDAQGLRYGIGFADGNRNNKSQSIAGADNVATTAEHHRRYNAILISQNSAGTIDFEADISELGTNEFKINIITNSLTAQIYIIFILFCGSDLEYCYVGQHTIPDALTGNKNVTYSIPFLATLDFFLPLRSSSIDSGSTGGRQSVGWAKSSTQRGAIMLSTQNGVAGANTVRHQRSDRCFIMPGSAGNFEGDADFVSHNAAGFTYNVTNTLVASDILCFMAFKGGIWECGSFNVSAGTGNQTVNLSDSTIVPAGSIIATVGNITNNTDTILDHCRLSIGAAESASVRAAAYGGHKDAANPTAIACCLDNTSILRMATENATATSSVVEVDLDASSFNAGNFVVNKSTNTGTLGTIAVLYIVLGEAQTLQRVSKSYIIKYDSKARTSKSYILKYNSKARASKLYTLKYNNKSRVSKGFILKFNNNARVAKSYILKYSNKSRVSKAYIIKYNNLVRVAKSYILKYNNKARIAKSYILKYSNKSRVVKTYILKYNNKARVSKFYIIKYNNLERIAKTYIIKYNNKARVIKQYILKYSNNARVSKGYILKYNNRARVSKQYIIKYTNLIRVSKNYIIKFNNKARVLKSYILKYDNRARISKPYIIKYDSKARVVKQYILKYNNIARVSKAYIIKFNNNARISKDYIIKYSSKARVSKAYILKYNNLVSGFTRVSKSYIIKYNNNVRVSKSYILKYNNKARVSKQYILKYSSMERISKLFILKYNSKARISKPYIIKYNNLNRVSKTFIIKYHNRIRISKSYILKYSNLARVSKSFRFVYHNFKLFLIQHIPAPLPRKGYHEWNTISRRAEFSPDLPIGSRLEEFRDEDESRRKYKNTETKHRNEWLRDL